MIRIGHAGLVAVAVLAASAMLVGCSSSMLHGEKFYIDSPGVGVALFPRDLDDVHDAALQALSDDLGYVIVGTGPDFIQARTSSDVRVKVELAPSGTNETRMEIDMGAETPEMVVRGVMSKIEARLKGS